MTPVTSSCGLREHTNTAYTKVFQLSETANQQSPSPRPAESDPETTSEPQHTNSAVYGLTVVEIRNFSGKSDSREGHDSFHRLPPAIRPRFAAIGLWRGAARSALSAAPRLPLQPVAPEMPPRGAPSIVLAAPINRRLVQTVLIHRRGIDHTSPSPQNPRHSHADLTCGTNFRTFSRMKGMSQQGPSGNQGQAANQSHK